MFFTQQTRVKTLFLGEILAAPPIPATTV